MQKRPRIESKKLRASAKGRDCVVRLYPGCDPATVVLAHLPGRISGTGGKENDLHGCFACAVCHDYIDGRRKWEEPPEVLERAMLRALAETQDVWMREGFVTIL